MVKPEDFGTNADGSQNQEYCTYCYQNGEFTFKGSVKEMIEKLIPMASKMGMTEEDPIFLSLASGAMLFIALHECRF